jgi:hypothetical protein
MVLAAVVVISAASFTVALFFGEKNECIAASHVFLDLRFCPNMEAQNLLSPVAVAGLFSSLLASKEKYDRKHGDIAHQNKHEHLTFAH